VTETTATLEWKSFLNKHPDAHLLQTAEWGELKSAFGWSHTFVPHAESGALVLFRRILPGLTIAYIPKGPIGEWSPDFIDAVKIASRTHGAFALKVEPDSIWDENLANLYTELGFQASPQSVQPARTITVDLRDDEDDLLMRMKSKTRYNIRLAGRKGVEVKAWSDIAAFADMMEETADRDEFGAHNKAYFRRAYDLFHPSGACELFVAEVEGSPVAAIMVFKRGERAWYLYGASRSIHREKMPTYALQWEAMRWAKESGCSLYDLWGIPDFDEQQLEEQFTERSDGLWGVYRFKRGFGGEVAKTMGAWDLIFDPLRYRLYTLALNLTGRL
jgi:lipid II:glycine glycyltransferase (peptidoglycan interpeptide bridge formation enzyme)